MNSRFEAADGFSSKKSDANGKFCPYCGTPVAPDFEYCNHCGKKLP